MAANLGFESFIARDATFTHDRISPDGRRWSAEDIHSSALASLHGEFATALTVDEIIIALPKQLEQRELVAK
jgi:hypothetical protein